jgi:hypothetical protein
MHDVPLGTNPTVFNRYSRAFFGVSTGGPPGLLFAAAAAAAARALDAPPDSAPLDDMPLSAPLASSAPVDELLVDKLNALMLELNPASPPPPPPSAPDAFAPPDAPVPLSS